MSRALLGLFVVAGLACTSAETAGRGQAPAAPASQGQGEGNPVVAEVAGQPITLQELDAKWKELDPAEQARVTQVVYQNRRNILDQMIGDILIEKAAKAAGITAEQYSAQEIGKRLKVPTDAEVRQFFEENKDRAPGRTFEQLREAITDFLKSQREQQARAQLVDELMKNKDASVKVTLDPPRTEVTLESHDPSRGPASAPITIIEFSDFQCPFCSRVAPTLERLVAAYPEKIRLVFKDFPLPNHTLAPKAAEAAHCASEQGKFWEMHDRMFHNQQQLDVPGLKQHAAALKLDQGKFDQCLDSGKYADVIKADMQQGAKLGIQSTPTLYVNGRPVIGAQPYEYFVSVVEEELARTGTK